jgi:acyl-CoA thioester hydrolase
MLKNIFPHKNSVSIELPVMSYETDFVGVVNNTEFIRFIERVRYALGKKFGFSFKQVRNAKMWVVMARVEINYRAPAHFEDLLIGTGWVEKVGNTSMTLSYEFRMKGTGRLIVDAKQVMVFIDHKFKPTPIPLSVRKKL